MPCTQLHSSAGDTIVVAVSSKIMWDENPPRLVLSAAPPAAQPFERKAHTSLRRRSRESPCAELRAGYVARHALACAVRAASYTQLRVALHVSTAKEFCFVWYAKVSEFHLHFRLFFLQIVSDVLL